MLTFKNRLVKNLNISGVDYSDYPDFCDAFFDYAEWENGTPLTDHELKLLTEQYCAIVNEMACENVIEAAESAYDYATDR